MMSNSKSLQVKATGITPKEKQLQSFLQLISDLWCIVAQDGYYQQINASYWKNVLGWNESELMGKPMLTFIHPEDVEATSFALSRLTKNQVIEFKTRTRHQDGSFRWISWRMNKNESGLIYGIGKEITLNDFEDKLKSQSYSEDIENTYEFINDACPKIELVKHKLQKIQQNVNFLTSEHKQNYQVCIKFKIIDIELLYELENKIKDTLIFEKTLYSLFSHQLENKLERIIYNLPLGILLLDSNFKIILANKIGSDYLNLLGEIEGSNILYKLGGKTLDKLIDCDLDKIITKLIPENCSDKIFEIIIQSLHLEPQQNHWLLTIHDISTSVKVDLEVHKALEKEKELNILKSSVINTVSHEYRTPLTNIILGVQLLKKYHGHLDSKRQMRCFEHIENSCRHLMELVDNMLLVSKAESGKLELNRTSLDLVLFTQQLLEDLKLVAGSDRKITFIQECSFIEAYLDCTLLRQILTNLLYNAIKYSPDGGEISLHLTYNDGVATFKIKDQGIGIPEADKQKLFESFQRGSNAGTIRGTGLGLAIVKKCVELHGGKIWFDSVVGNGTNFYVKLPC